MHREWNIDIARKIYGLKHSLREDFINVDEDGNLYVKVGNEKIVIKELMEKYNLDIAYIRVLPLIEKSMRLVYETFSTLSQLHGYRGRFQPVFPMKVNPIPVVIEAIWRYGEKYGWGFNTGSIGELALLQGFADRGPRVLIYDGVISGNVIEMLKKLKERGWRIIVDAESERDLEVLGKYPEFEIGLRIKPILKAGSKWAHSAGFAGKFGLTVNTLMNLLSEYKWVSERSTLLHMHAGSQIYRLTDLKILFREMRSIYTSLRKIGFERLEIVDPGGGLAYPYVDVRNNTPEMPDYTVVEYFNELIKAFKDVQPPPTLAFEGGRFIVSAHRIVVAKVVDIRAYSAQQSKTTDVFPRPECLDTSNTLTELESCLKEAKTKLSSILSKRRGLLDKLEALEDILSDMKEEVAAKIGSIVKKDPAALGELVKHPTLMSIAVSPSKRYVLNMSVFADIPDAVVVNQYFQPVPVSKLNERPHVLGVLADLTCDSMGEINEFISYIDDDVDRELLFTQMDNRLMMAPGQKIRLRGIPLHLPSKNENYYVAFLDTGAYQDPLAMKHNLIYGAPEVIIDEKDGKVVVEFVEKQEKYYL